MKNLSKKILLTLLTTSLVSISAGMASTNGDESLQSGLNGEREALLGTTRGINPPRYRIVGTETEQTGCCCWRTTVTVSRTIETSVEEILQNAQWLIDNTAFNKRELSAIGSVGEHVSSTFAFIDALYGNAIIAALGEDKDKAPPPSGNNIRAITESESIPGIAPFASQVHTTRVFGTTRPIRPADTFAENCSVVRAFYAATKTLKTPFKVKVIGDRVNPTRRDVTFMANGQELDNFWAPLVVLGLLNYGSGGKTTYTDQPLVQLGLTAVRAPFIGRLHVSPESHRAVAKAKTGTRVEEDDLPTGGKPAVTFAATHDRVHERAESRGSSVNSSPRRDDVLLDVKMELGFTFSDDIELAAFAGGRLLMNERDNVKQLREFLEKADDTIDAGVIAADKFGIRLRDEIDGLLEKQAKTVAIALLSIIKQNASSLTLTAAENPLAFAMLPYLTGTAEIPIYVGDMLSAVSHFGFTHGHQYYFGTSTGKANAPLEDLLSIVSELTGTVSEIDPSKFAE